MNGVGSFSKEAPESSLALSILTKSWKVLSVSQEEGLHQNSTMLVP